MPFAPSNEDNSPNKAIIRRTAVFLKELRNGGYVYIREPYDIVEYDRGRQAAGAPVMQTYVQPRSGICRPGHEGVTEVGTLSTTSVEEVYDDIMFLDKPDPGSPYRRP